MIDTFSLLQKYTGINRYSQSEVITPQNIVKDMVDLLPQEIFNPDATFFDPAVKSGRFLIEVYNRLMVSPLLAHIPEPDRHKHIIEKQLYGFTTSQTAAIVARKALYDDQLFTGNIRFTSDKLTQELIQGAFSIMNFDVVIGNPPYNKGADLDFVNLGFELSTKYCVMIVPAKWQTAEDDQRVMSEMTYGKFRKKLVPHMSHVVFYPDSFDVFDIQLKEGISYFILDKEAHEKCSVKNCSLLQSKINCTKLRSITNGESLWNIGDEILRIFGKHKKYVFGDMSKRYRVYTNKNMSHGGGHLASGGGNIKGSGTGGYFFTQNGDLNCVSKSSIEDSECAVVLKQSYVTQTYSANSRAECESFVSWLNCKFTRFFVMIGLSRRDVQFDNYGFRFVPAPPSGKFDHIYTDAELYRDFHLPQKYIDVIEAVIKERK